MSTQFGRRVIEFFWDVLLFQLYAPQTKIFDGGTNRSMSLFEPLFKGLTTRFKVLDTENLQDDTKDSSLRGYVLVSWML